MNRNQLIWLYWTVLLALAACRAGPEKTTGGQTVKTFNPLVYFEIPVTDMERAIRFYTHVFGFRFQRTTIDGNEMALFPASEGAAGASGALAKGPVYRPTKAGAILYFHTADIDQTLAKAVSAGGALLYPKTGVAPGGFVAEFSDSEGNRIALHQAAP